MPKKKRMTNKRTEYRRKTKAEHIATMPIETVSRLGGDEGIAKLRQYVRTLKTGYTRRVGQFKRHGVISYAQISLEESMTDQAKKRKIKDMNRNQLLMEFARYSKFFRDKTSTIAGINEVNLEQDKRIFGLDEKGKPLFRMTDKQRKEYWSLYDEFIHQNLEYISMYGSDRVQQAVAEAVYETGSVLDFTSIFKKASDKLKEQAQEEPRHGPNVYSGRGPTFQ